MTDRLDARLRQLVQEIHDTSPDPHSWESIDPATAVGHRRRGSRMLVPAAAAAALVIIAAAVIAVDVGRHDTRPQIDVTNTEETQPTNSTGSIPSSVPTTVVDLPPSTTDAAPPSNAPTSTIPTSTPPSSTPPSTEPAPTNASVPITAPPPIGVSYRSPPQALELQPLAGVAVAVNPNAPDALPPIAALDAGRAAVVDSLGHQITILSLAGATEVVPLAVDPAPFVVTGAHDMIYGVVARPEPDDLGAAAAVAIPLSGPNAGQEIATEEININDVIEAPPTILGLGRTGVVNRRNGGELIAYRSTDGGPSEQGSAPARYVLEPDGTVRSEFGEAAWSLSIERDPGYRGSGFIPDPDPVEIGDGRALYSTSIGAPADPSGDFPEATVPVIAVLEPAGAGTWYSLPGGWQVVAADTTGVVFARRAGAMIEVALLPMELLDPPIGIGAPDPSSGVDELRVPVSGGTTLETTPFVTVPWGSGPGEIGLQNGEITTPAGLKPTSRPGLPRGSGARTEDGTSPPAIPLVPCSPP